jgi:hypothetical protein
MEDVQTRLIIDGVYWPLQHVDLLVVCTWICVVWCVELGMRREVVVTLWVLILPE